jgi:hypothetical protein
MLKKLDLNPNFKSDEKNIEEFKEMIKNNSYSIIEIKIGIHTGKYVKANNRYKKDGYIILSAF